MVLEMIGTRRMSFAAAFALVALVIAPNSVSAAFKTVRVKAEGYDRRNAINNALRAAVEQAGGVKLTSMSKTRNFQLVMDTVIATSTGVVKEYTLLTDKAQGDKSSGTHLIEMEATVSEENLFNDLDAVRVTLEQHGSPRVLVMISEQNTGSANMETWWTNPDAKALSQDIAENTLIKAWNPYGFRFIDRGALVGKFRASNPSTAEVKEVASTVDADVVILGSAIATKATEGNGLVPKDSPLRTINAKVTARVLYVDTGEILGSENGRAGFLSINPEEGGAQMIEIATKRVSDGLLEQIMKRWQEANNGPRRLSVKATGFKRSRDFRNFMKTIQNKIDSVRQVEQKGYKKGSAQFDVMFAGSAFDFGEAIEAAKFPGFSIELEEVTGNTITFSVAK